MLLLFDRQVQQYIVAKIEHVAEEHIERGRLILSNLASPGGYDAVRLYHAPASGH